MLLASQSVWFCLKLRRSLLKSINYGLSALYKARARPLTSYDGCRAPNNNNDNELQFIQTRPIPFKNVGSFRKCSLLNHVFRWGLRSFREWTRILIIALSRHLTETLINC